MLLIPASSYIREIAGNRSEIDIILLLSSFVILLALSLVFCIVVLYLLIEEMLEDACFILAEFFIDTVMIFERQNLFLPTS